MRSDKMQTIEYSTKRKHVEDIESGEKKKDNQESELQ